MSCVLVTRELPWTDAPISLAEAFDEVRVVEKGRPLTRDELLEYIVGVDSVICQLTDRFDRSVIERATALRHIATMSMGLDHLELKAIRDRGIRVSNTPNVLSEATADLAFSLILACARRLRPAMETIVEGRFVGFGPSLHLGIELNGATLGIIGYGSIGKALAKRAEGFGMKVLWLSRNAGNTDLETLLKSADIISLHCPLTPDTEKMIDATALKKMKPDAILINTARGKIIDEAALFAHARSHPNFYAGLDVFEREPAIVSGLAKLSNVICLPHIGSASAKTRRRMAEMCVGEAVRFSNALPLKYEVVQ